jgi:hypothetical protein
VVAELSRGRVVVLGHATGSHLGLSDEKERMVSVIWLAGVRGGQLCCCRLLEDTPARQPDLGLSRLTWRTASVQRRHHGRLGWLLEDHDAAVIPGRGRISGGSRCSSFVRGAMTRVLGCLGSRQLLRARTAR